MALHRPITAPKTVVKDTVSSTQSSTPNIPISSEGERAESELGWQLKSRTWRLPEKSSYGYFWSIGIGFFGPLIGLLIADYQQDQGVKSLANAREQSELLEDFKSSVEEAQFNSYRLISLVDNPEKFNNKKIYLAGNVRQVNNARSKIEKFALSRPLVLVERADRLQDLLRNYTTQINLYSQEINSALQKPEDLDKVEKRLANLDKLNQELAIVLEKAKEKVKQEELNRQASQVVEKQIIIISILLSAVIAGMVASRTSLNHFIQLSRRSRESQKFAAKAESQALNLQKTLDKLQNTQSQLIQTEKMSGLGQMVAGVAHEINNPISFIHGNLSHAREYTGDLLRLVQMYQEKVTEPIPEIEEEAENIDLEFLQEDLPKLLASMQVGTERICEIVRSLKNFSRLDEKGKKYADLHEGINNTLMILGNKLKAKSSFPGIQIIKDYTDLPRIKCHPGQINQVFMNIIANAVDALKDFHHQQQNAAFCFLPQVVIRTELKENDRVVIRIADNGPGMTEKVHSRLFDPFFTTKSVGKGTGLGLSISHQIIVEKHGGQLWCISTPGKGSEFIIEIPIPPDH
ncbi:MAG: ATP-binding protein [Spirulinaceae cyanobacterium]